MTDSYKKELICEHRGSGSFPNEYRVSMASALAFENGVKLFKMLDQPSPKNLFSIFLHQI